jgi:hypothetical protein
VRTSSHAFLANHGADDIIDGINKRVHKLCRIDVEGIKFCD